MTGRDLELEATVLSIITRTEMSWPNLRGQLWGHLNILPVTLTEYVPPLPQFFLFCPYFHWWQILFLLQLAFSFVVAQVV